MWMDVNERGSGQCRWMRRCSCEYALACAYSQCRYEHGANMKKGRAKTKVDHITLHRPSSERDDWEEKRKKRRKESKTHITCTAQLPFNRPA
mmetsp:Transcript_1741/g.3670  ORF Transcript_1741/g.3670 Transcript_1741/m.3670 type:complete len:92 (+) Transcript_1741:969-1244(+)